MDPAVTPVVAPTRRVYERPTGAALTGATALLVGAWGAIAVYVGPYFGFRPTSMSTWNGSLDNGLLHLLPGAVAAAAGLMLMGMGPARRSVRNAALLLPALMLLAAGAWFVIGPIAWPTFESSAPFVTGVSAATNLLNVACASFAPGLVLVMLGGMAWKTATVRPVAVEDPLTPAESGVVPAASPTMTRSAVPARDVTGTGAPATTTMPAAETRRVD